MLKQATQGQQGLGLGTGLLSTDYVRGAGKMFDINFKTKPRMNNIILVCGMMGIGSVGRIALDNIVKWCGAKEFAVVHSHYFPHSVFVNEKNLISLPCVKLMHKKIGRQDFVFLSGDAQPVNEFACYGLCEKVFGMLQDYGIREIVTLGGIGMQKIPKKPLVYVTGNDKAFLKYKGCLTNIYGVVGPIVGVTGLLAGLAGKRRIPATIVLAQTFGHPAYLGIRGSKEIINVLNERFGWNVPLKTLDQDIARVEEELKSRLKGKALELPTLQPHMKPFIPEMPKKPKKDINYFG